MVVIQLKAFFWQTLNILNVLLVQVPNTIH